MTPARHGSQMSGYPILDQLGEHCPAPIIALGRWAKAQPPGSTVDLLADDPAAMHDVAAWCRMRGAELISTAPLEAEPLESVPLIEPRLAGIRYRIRLPALPTQNRR